MSDAQRADCIRARLRFEAVNRSVQDYASERQNSQEFKDNRSVISQKVVDMSNHPPKNPKPDELALWQKKITWYQNAEMAFINDHLGMPDAYSALGTHGIEAADKLAQAYLPGLDKLSGLKGAELENALKPGSLFAEKSPYRVPQAPEWKPEAVKAQEKPQPEAAPQDMAYSGRMGYQAGII